MIEVFNISQDDDESDTSQEDLEEGIIEGENRHNDKIPDFHTWKRQPVPSNFPNPKGRMPFRFYLMDCDFGITSSQNIPVGLIPFPTRSRFRLPPVCKEQSYMRLHGITESGNSVCCNAFGFLPYFYALPSLEFYREYTQQFKTLLVAAVTQKISSSLSPVPYHDMVKNCPIVSVEVFDIKDFKNIYDLHLSSSRTGDTYSRFAPINVLKITCALPKFVWTAGKILKANEITFPGIKECCRYDIYEATINHTIRFLSDTNLSACSWLEILSENYFLRTEETKLSHAQLEVDIYYESITVVSPGEDLADTVPPIRLLSFDIECMTRPKRYDFPRDGKERVLQIGNLLATYGGSDVPRKVVFALGDCEVSEATEIFSFQEEEVMLEAWRLFVLSTDPDIIMGYNIRKFDIPYLIDRANHIQVDRFPFLGRLRTNQSIVREVKLGPKQMYEHDDKKVIVCGRVVLDMYLLMMRHNTIPGKCALADVSIRYLKTERKIDVHYTQIFRMQNLGKQTRTELAEYCIQDCVLPYKLLLHHNPNPSKNPKGNVLSYYIEKARTTGTPLKYLVTKSKEYALYFRMVRTQKNPAVKFVPDTPTPVKLKRRRASEPGKNYSPKRLDYNFPLDSIE